MADFRVVNCDLTNNGILVEYSDGKTFLFANSFLAANRYQAAEVLNHNMGAAQKKRDQSIINLYLETTKPAA